MSSDSQAERLKGTVNRVTFRNQENGYVVLQLLSAHKNEKITVVGHCHDEQVQIGSTLVLQGIFKKHPKFGRQFHAISFAAVPPDSLEGLEKYLGSGVLKGIGPKTAKRLVDAFGLEALHILENEPDKIAGVKGITRKKAEELAAILEQRQERRETEKFLIERNISINLANKIIDRYQEKTLQLMKQDPYRLAREVRGIGFLTADSIALNLGFDSESPQRLKAGLYYALEQGADEGHCFLPRELLFKRAKALLQLPEEANLTAQLEELMLEGFVLEREDNYYQRQLFKAEEFVSMFIAGRIQETPKPQIDQKLVAQALKRAATQLKLEFSAEQTQAVIDATRFSLLVITGGPGCGKTTIIRAINEVYRQAGKRLLLAAPTGRAAQRMAQVCSTHAGTIHRLLRYDPHRGRFLHGLDLPLSADAIIIDESSMIDINLARDLFAAIGADTKLILVGDKDQLPSVGPGRVFADIVGLSKARIVGLSRLFRRSEQSAITDLAHTINAGIVPEIPSPDGKLKSDAYFISKTEQEDAATIIESLVAEQLPRKFALDVSDITVLTPSNRGPLGTQELNSRLQKCVNLLARDPDALKIEQNGLSFYPGDRVCQRVNNYNLHEAGVFNGDLGIVQSVNPRDRSLVVEMWDGRLVRYESTDLNQLSLAYAISVHRSQGSEIPCVVLAVHETHYTLLERQLLYTAVTRAKKLLVVVGTKKALAIATRRTEAQKRFTAIRQRVQELL